MTRNVGLVISYFLLFSRTREGRKRKERENNLRAGDRLYLEFKNSILLVSVLIYCYPFAQGILFLHRIIAAIFSLKHQDRFPVSSVY